MGITTDTSDTDSPCIVTTTMQKGGTGKTTSAINTAGALSDTGSNVLFVDLDPQGNASEDLGLEDHYGDDGENIYDAITGQDVDVHDLVVEHEEMYVIPSNKDMTTARYDISDPTKFRSWKRDLPGDWDFVVVDTPPSLCPITDSAVIAADVLVPVAQARKSSMRSIDLLLDQIDELHDHFDFDASIEAVVANEARNDSESKEMIDWLEDLGVPVAEIRTRVALQRAANEGVSTFVHGEDSGMEDEYRRVAEAVKEGCSHV